MHLVRYVSGRSRDIEARDDMDLYGAMFLANFAHIYGRIRQPPDGMIYTVVVGISSISAALLYFCKTGAKSSVDWLETKLEANKSLALSLNVVTLMQR